MTKAIAITLITMAMILLFPAFAQAQVGVTLSPWPRMQFLNSSGQVLSGGLVYTYQSGTSTPQATYTDSTGTTQNTDPITLDSSGSAQIWLAGGQIYRFTVTDSNNVQQWVVDGVSGPPTLLSPGPIGTTTPNVVESTEFLSANPLPALSGIMRLANGDKLCWRNSANSADICLSANSSNQFIFNSTLMCSSFENIKCVDATNTAGWAGSDYGAWVSSAIASLPTVNGYSSGEILLAPSLTVVTQSSGVAITSPFVSIIGPGAGALQINCTYNGNCWDLHTNPFVIWPGAVIRGFSLTGIGTTNANAVGLHVGDVIGGSYTDLAIDNFRGANSSCIWVDNINGFFERNMFLQDQTGLSQAGQNGCTKDWRFTNTGGTQFNSSFEHNFFVGDKFTIFAGQTAISQEGGSIVDTHLYFDGNVASGSTGIVLAMSGTTYSGGGDSLFDAALDLTVECTTPCTGGELLNLPSGYLLNNHNGYVFDSSGLLTLITGSGRYTKQLGDPESAGQVRTNTTNSDGSLTFFDTTTSAVNPQKFMRMSGGHLQTLNSAFGTVIADLSDSGWLTQNVFQTNSANPAQSGVVRLANGDGVCWRNAANNGDVCLASLQTVYTGSLSGTQSISATTPTVVTQAGIASIPIPSVGLWRIRVCYTMNWTSGATPNVDFWVTDGTGTGLSHSWASSTLTAATSGSNQQSNHACEVSPSTYTNAVTATVSLSLNVESLNAIVIQNAPLYSPVPSRMTAEVIPSN